ncbi:acyl-CoA dehydrogenase family protein [Kocuria rosea]|uniref:acyl-CoA dehydrogenase family protein n=1 Tax=Kocuria rosea TaxID=1275 RepID=UPI00204019D6|nr:acyl-CoA dehydrogenase [Kocuria rosea]MCM3687895.1 acyl-CoA dehydrogenase family protein [Kocuria rosea]
MTTTVDRPVPPPTAADPAVDVAALGELLLGRWAEVRRETRRMLLDERLHTRENLTYQDQRERVLGQLHLLVEHGTMSRGLPEAYGGQDDPGGNVSGFEELLLGDPSMQIKAGVQWGLFGSAVLNLGTAEHHRRWLDGIRDLTVPGVFAMTETGHGSDVASIGTTATYDPATEEFEIHTPFRAAWKDYLGNAAVHGRAAVVFAQLITLGVDHGVHAFYVEIRDEDGNFLPGVGGEDDGHKGGLNGIDNGRLHFTRVRVPRTHLLNKYGDVAPDGTYSSSIASPGRRFFTMIGTLVQGRVSLDGAAVVANKVALSIAVRYGSERRQFNASSDVQEEVLLDYQQHQRRLLPLLAETYAMHFAHQELLHKYDDVFSGREDTDENRQDLETLAAALKALSTWSALETLQTCREACGGAGFLTKNRLTSLRHDLDVYATFEGDNTVLLQLVAKRLLSDWSNEFKNVDVGVMARYVAGRATEATYHRSGLRKLGQAFRDTGDVRRSVNALRDESAQHALLADRVETMVAEIAEALRPSAKLPRAEAAALFNDHQYKLIAVARAHAELLQWEAFTRGVQQVEDPGTRTVLTWLRDVFGLRLIEKNLAWYLSYGRLSMRRGRSIDEYIDRLLARLRPHALDLVAAFELAPEHLRAEIATGIEARRQEEAAEHYRRLRASGDAPVKERAPARRSAAPAAGAPGEKAPEERKKERRAEKQAERRTEKQAERRHERRLELKPLKKAEKRAEHRPGPEPEQTPEQGAGPQPGKKAGRKAGKRAEVRGRGADAPAGAPETAPVEA